MHGIEPSQDVPISNKQVARCLTTYSDVRFNYRFRGTQIMCPTTTTKTFDQVDHIEIQIRKFFNSPNFTHYAYCYGRTEVLIEHLRTTDTVVWTPL